MTDKSIRCPICGTANKENADSCEKCKTRLTKRNNGTPGVKSPRTRGKTHIMVDIEDPLTRKKLEELTLIPGVSRKKALLLYQSGIHSIEEFMEKAFHGERFSVNYSRTVSNKLLVQSLKGKKKGKKADIICPSCNAPNPLTSTKCKVCNFDIETDMKNVDMAEVSGKINDSVKEILDTLSESDDFQQLPDELKRQFATAIESDNIDFDMEKPKQYDSLGLNLESPESGQEAVAEPESRADTPEGPSKPDAESPPEPEPPAENTAKEDAPNAPEPAAAKDKKALEKQEKIRKIMTEKMVKWRKSGYDVESLEQYLNDVEGFKKKAKEVLEQGKVVKSKYLKQLEMWREKGFDISELEPVLESDVDMFPEKAKELLKKQKKN